MFKKLKNNIEDYFFSHFAMTKRQRSGFLVLIFLILLTELALHFYPFQQNQGEIKTFSPTEEALALQLNAQKEEANSKTNFKQADLTSFNPNALDAKGFEAIGFSAKQAASLIKYRNSLGGNFASVEEFKSAYVISDWMFEKIKPHIDLKPFKANLVQRNYVQNNRLNAKINFKTKTIQPFFINKLSHAEIMDLGFSERQATTILNFKNSLPGKKFENADQFHKCYAVNDYMFEKLKPYIQFEKSANNTINNKIIQNQETLINPDTMSLEDWERLDFDRETAGNIIKYREFIGGFNSLEDLKNCRYITESDFDRIKEKVRFDTD